MVFNKDELWRKVESLNLTVSVQGKIERWIEKNSDLLERWRAVVANIRSAKSMEPVMISVALRELLAIVQSYAYKQKKN